MVYSIKCEYQIIHKVWMLGVGLGWIECLLLDYKHDKGFGWVSELGIFCDSLVYILT